MYTNFNDYLKENVDKKLSKKYDELSDKQLEKDKKVDGLNKVLLYKKDDFKVYSVNGEFVRGNGFNDWVAGGHYYVDAYLPKDEQEYAKFIGKDEIWVDNNLLTKIVDLTAIILHERVERYMMKEHGLKYDDAHNNYADKVEVKFRKKVKDGMETTISDELYDEFVKNYEKK
jgi:hypothetical protein